MNVTGDDLGACPRGVLPEYLCGNHLNQLVEGADQTQDIRARLMLEEEEW